MAAKNNQDVVRSNGSVNEVLPISVNLLILLILVKRLINPQFVGDVEAMGCAHLRAEMYYIESVTNPTGFRARDVFMGGPSIDPK